MHRFIEIVGCKFLIINSILTLDFIYRYGPIIFWAEPQNSLQGGLDDNDNNDVFNKITLTFCEKLILKLLL